MCAQSLKYLLKYKEILEKQYKRSVKIRRDSEICCQNLGNQKSTKNVYC